MANPQTNAGAGTVGKTTTGSTSATTGTVSPALTRLVTEWNSNETLRTQLQTADIPTIKKILQGKGIQGPELDSVANFIAQNKGQDLGKRFNAFLAGGLRR